MSALPDWPRMLSRPMAAAYCSLTVPTFEREVAAGLLPLPIQLGGQPHWCRRKLDAALDRLTTGPVYNWRDAAKSNIGKVA